MIYLVAAYFVFWALTMIYLFTLDSRQRRLQRELAALQRTRQAE